MLSLDGRDHKVIIPRDNMDDREREAEERGRRAMELIKNRELDELEARRAELERIEREKREKIMFLMNKFKGHIYRLILPGLFFKGTSYLNMMIRKRKLREYEDTFAPIQDAVVTNLIDSMRRAARAFWEMEESIHVITSTGKQAFYKERVPSEKEANRRCDIILETITLILKELLSDRFEAKLSEYILSFIGFYFANGSHLKGEFHMDYELERLNFNSYGGLA